MYVGVPLVLAALVLVYLNFDPAGNVLFPKCIFKSLTGLDCPGCGSQRAIHHLLNGELSAAWVVNPLVIVAIPYVALGIVVQIFKNRYAWALMLRKRLYGIVAIWTVFTVVMLFWIVRNVI